VNAGLSPDTEITAFLGVEAMSVDGLRLRERVGELPHGGGDVFPDGEPVDEVPATTVKGIAQVDRIDAVAWRGEDDGRVGPELRAIAVSDLSAVGTVKDEHGLKPPGHTVREKRLQFTTGGVQRNGLSGLGVEAIDVDVTRVDLPIDAYGQVERWVDRLFVGSARLGLQGLRAIADDEMDRAARPEPCQQPHFIWARFDVPRDVEAGADVLSQPGGPSQSQLFEEEVLVLNATQVVLRRANVMVPQGPEVWSIGNLAHKALRDRSSLAGHG